MQIQLITSIEKARRALKAEHFEGERIYPFLAEDGTTSATSHELERFFKSWLQYQHGQDHLSARKTLQMALRSIGSCLEPLLGKEYRSGCLSELDVINEYGVAVTQRWHRQFFGYDISLQEDLLTNVDVIMRAVHGMQPAIDPVRLLSAIDATRKWHSNNDFDERGLISKMERLGLGQDTALGVIIDSYESVLTATTTLVQNWMRSRPELNELSIEDFVSECLRLHCPFAIINRRCSFPLDDIAVKIDISKCNRDPEVFECPDAYRPARPRRDLTFGYGMHACPAKNYVTDFLCTMLTEADRDPTASPDLVSFD